MLYSTRRLFGEKNRWRFIWHKLGFIVTVISSVWDTIVFYSQMRLENSQNAALIPLGLYGYVGAVVRFPNIKVDFWGIKNYSWYRTWRRLVFGVVHPKIDIPRQLVLLVLSKGQILFRLAKMSTQYSWICSTRNWFY